MISHPPEVASLTQECVVAAVEGHVVVGKVAQVPLTDHVGGVSLPPELVSEGGQVEWQPVPLYSVDDVMLEPGVELANRNAQLLSLSLASLYLTAVVVGHAPSRVTYLLQA